MMTPRRIDIDLSTQTLCLLKGERKLLRYTVSTARNGAGQCQGSECTPLGHHRIHLKIGADCPAGTVFVARRPTGEIWTPELARAYPGRDWILTRILWLTGCEPGYNRGGGCDSLRRFIYIHGTPDDQPMGEPCSHGCVRMRNTDIIALFKRVECGTDVLIHPGGAGRSC